MMVSTFFCILVLMCLAAVGLVLVASGVAPSENDFQIDLCESLVDRNQGRVKYGQGDECASGRLSPELCAVTGVFRDGIWHRCTVRAREAGQDL